MTDEEKMEQLKPAIAQIRDFCEKTFKEYMKCNCPFRTKGPFGCALIGVPKYYPESY